VSQNVFKLTGLDKSIKKLKGLEAKVSKKVVRQAMRAGMKLVQQAVKNNAPVDSGDLKEGVKVRATKRSRKKMGIMVSIGGKPNYVGDLYYGAMVEWGTKYQSPQGFMRRSFDETHDQAIEIASAGIISGVEKELSK